MAVDGTGGGSVDMPDDYRSRQPSRGSGLYLRKLK